MSHIIDMTATEMAAAIRAGHLSAEEAVAAHLARIEAINPKINAVVQQAPEQALEAARRADQKHATGAPLGPLHGVPMTLKDSIDTADFVTTWGTPGRHSFIPQKDATVTARLRAAGAIIIGKTNTPEFTLGSETVNEIYGQTVNPYDLTRTPCGSSGGSAALLAVRGTPIELGSDTGGSIREPAHVCGIAGLKPTSGRVPRTGHAVGYGLGAVDSLTQIGPMARSAADLAMVLKVIAGPDGHDPAVPPAALGDPDAVLPSDLRIAHYTGGGLPEPCPEIARAVNSAAEAMGHLGSRITEAAPPGLADVSDLYLRLRYSSGSGWLRDYLADLGLSPPGAPLASRLADESTAPQARADLSKVLREVDSFRIAALKFMEPFDVILCPAACFAAQELNSDHLIPNRQEMWGHLYYLNLLGWPAAVIPAGMTDQGLPIGLQIVGPPWREDLVLALAMALEKALPGCPAPGL
ncbi:MAG: amidase [Pseudomonadota bacterium]